MIAMDTYHIIQSLGQKAGLKAKPASNSQLLLKNLTSSPSDSFEQLI